MLNKRSKELRLKILKLSKANGGYHYGGSFSCVEILMSLFDNVLKDEEDNKETNKASGKQKLKDLGLDDAEIKALIG